MKIFCRKANINMKILVLGGTGYLGSKVIKRLLENKEEVYCIIHKTILEYSGDNIHYIKIEDIENFIRGNNIGFELFLNLACLYEKSIELSKIAEINTEIPMHILNILIDNSSILRCINISTSLPPWYNIYSFSKDVFSQYGRFISKLKNIKFVDVKLEAFYGVDEPRERFITWLITQMLENKEILLTDGTQKRDYIYIDDVVAGLIKLVYLELEQCCCIPFRTGSPPTIKQIVLYLKQITNTESNIIFGAINSNQKNPSTEQDDDMMKKLGIELHINWREGMQKMVDYNRK